MPVIVEQTIRIDSQVLGIACAVLLAALVATWLWIPITKARSYRRGADDAEPKLTRDLAIANGKTEAARGTMRELRMALAEAKATIAMLRGLGSDIAHRAARLVTAVDDPSEREAHILRIGGKRP